MFAFQKVSKSAVAVTSGVAVFGVLALARRVWTRRHRVELDVLGSQVGFYPGAFGKLFYRQSLGDVVYEVRPKSVVLPQSGDTTGAMVDCTFVEVPKLSNNESLIASSPVPRPALKLPNFACEIGVETADGVMTVIGMGFRVQNYLITARHVFDLKGRMGYKATSVILRNGNVNVRVSLSEPPVFPDGKFSPGTYRDCAAYLLTPGEWAGLGLRTLRSTDLSYRGEGPIEVFGRPGTTLMVSSGVIVRDESMEARRGILSHSANTTETYSGSPVITLIGGVPKIVAMHIAGGEGVNYAVGAYGLRKLFVKLGFLQTSKTGAVWHLLTGTEESREDARKQAEIDEEEDWDERSDYESDPDDPNSLRNRMHGTGQNRDRVGRRRLRRTVDPEGRVDIPESELAKEAEEFHAFLLAATLADNWPMSYQGWVRRSCCSASGFGKTRITRAVELLVREGRIRIELYQQEQWFVVREEKETPEVDSPASPLPAHCPAPGLKCPHDPSAPPMWETATTAPPPSVQMDVQSRAAPAVMWPLETFTFGEGTPRFWTNNVKNATEPLPPVELTSARMEAIAQWMGSGDWTALESLRGVGAQSISAHPSLAEYMKYTRSGELKIWKQPNERPSCRAMNLRGDLHAYRYGSCGRSHGKSSGLRTISEDFKQALDKVAPEYSRQVGEHVLPPSGPDAVHESFVGQCARQAPGTWDELKQQSGFDSKVREFCGLYPVVSPATSAPLGELVDTYLDSMDGSKSAGWSARYLPGSKGAWVKDNRDLLLYLVACRLMMRVAEGANIHTLAPEHFTPLGLRDPAEVFTKGEAHDGKKATSRRWRLIWIASMIDSVCQDVLHRKQNKADILAYGDGRLNVQAVGLGHHDDGIERVGQAFERMSHGVNDLKCSDASGWDLSVCRDAIYFDAERRVSRLNAVSTINRDLLYAEAACNSAHSLVIGTSVWTFVNYGITASGIPSTSAQNSPIRSFVLEACGATGVVSLGDDEVHTGEVDGKLLASTGCITKEGSETCSGPLGPVDFTSHIFVKDGMRWTAKFNNFAKMLAHLDLRRVATDAPGLDMMAGMRFALRHTPEADDTFVRVCREMGWSVAEAKDIQWERM